MITTAVVALLGVLPMQAVPRVDTVHVEARTVLVQVVLVSTNERVLVEAVLTADSTLYLPTEPVHELLGIGGPSGQLVTVAELQAAYPTAQVVWVPSELRVLIFDPLEVFAATRKARAESVARTQVAFNLPVQSGPFASIAVDDSLRGVLDLGYSYRGRASFAARVDDRGAGSWGVTVAPDPRLFLTITDATQGPLTVSGRVAAGPVWLSTSYTPDRPVDVAGLVRFRDVQFFASRQYGVLTYNRSSQWTVQVAHHWEQQRTAARISAGPSWASPFSFPVTSLTARR
jgi:hypothetical protein